MFAAAAFAAAEVGLTLFLGRFFDWGRAEALPFYGFRPWLCLAAVLIVSRWHWRERGLFYLLALLVTGASESLLLLALGAQDPWPEMLRGFLAGAMLLVLFDAVLQLGRAAAGRAGRLAGAGLLAVALLVPGSLAAYDSILIPTRSPPGAKPRLMLMTGLPIIWGEAGPFDPDSRPAAAYRIVQEAFEVEPLDVLDEAALGSGKLLLLAQPRALAPLELVALDSWLRRGGRAIILTDPDLLWPSGLPLGDARRPPAIGLLDPLLAHWGVTLVSGQSRGVVREDLEVGGVTRRLAMAAPGRFSTSDSSCRRWIRPYLARCAFGSGRALLVADADLFHDALWAAAGGAQRHWRTADNPLLLLDWLDRLIGVSRSRLDPPVEWVPSGSSRRIPFAAALLPILLAVGGGLAARQFARR